MYTACADLLESLLRGIYTVSLPSSNAVTRGAEIPNTLYHWFNLTNHPPSQTLDGKVYRKCAYQICNLTFLSTAHPGFFQFPSFVDLAGQSNLATVRIRL